MFVQKKWEPNHKVKVFNTLLQLVKLVNNKKTDFFFFFTKTSACTLIQVLHLLICLKNTIVLGVV